MFDDSTCIASSMVLQEKSYKNQMGIHIYIYIYIYKRYAGLSSNNERGVRIGGKIKGEHMACEDSGMTRRNKGRIGRKIRRGETGGDREGYFY